MMDYLLIIMVKQYYMTGTIQILLKKKSFLFVDYLSFFFNPSNKKNKNNLKTIENNSKC